MVSTCVEKSCPGKNVWLDRGFSGPVVESCEPGILCLHLGVDGLRSCPLVIHSHPLELAQELAIHRVGRSKLKRNISNSTSEYKATIGEVSLVLSGRAVTWQPTS